MRYPTISTQLALLLVSLTPNDAFTFLPLRPTSQKRFTRPAIASLSAVKVNQLLPPPPPPPAALSPLNDANILEQALRGFHNSLTSLHVPDLDSLRESLNMESLRESLSFLDVSAPLNEQVVELKLQLEHLDADFIRQLQSLAQNLYQGILTENPDFNPIVQQVFVFPDPI